MKSFYLIDLENVGRQFLPGIDELTIEDTIVVCHNKAMGPMSDEISKGLYHTKATVKIVNIFNHGKNAMDFCICTQLGYFIAEYGGTAKYYIVSNDKGYEAAIDFAKSLDQNVSVKLVGSLKVMQSELRGQQEEREILEDLLPDCTHKELAAVQRCLANTKTKEKFHCALQKELYPERAKEIYHHVKHLME